MTVLVIQHLKNQIILTADSGWFRNNSKENLGSKIREVNNQVFSSTGSVSEIDLFECFCLTRKPENNSQLAIVRFFCDFRKYLADLYGIGDYSIANNYFYVYEKQPYHYQNAIRHIKEGNYRTDGAGYAEATMCMFLGLSPKEAVEKTVALNAQTSGEVQEVIIYK